MTVGLALKINNKIKIAFDRMLSDENNSFCVPDSKMIKIGNFIFGFAGDLKDFKRIEQAKEFIEFKIKNTMEHEVISKQIFNFVDRRGNVILCSKDKISAFNYDSSATKIREAKILCHNDKEFISVGIGKELIVGNLYSNKEMDFESIFKNAFTMCNSYYPESISYKHDIYDLENFEIKTVE